jgi:hypothetical protein
MVAFRTASVEGQFLFSTESGVPELLETMSADAYWIADRPRRQDMAGKMLDEQKFDNEKNERMLRFGTALEPLREKMAPFLNFHSYSALPGLLDDLDE